MKFEQMEREYIYHMLAAHGTAHADDLVRLKALLRRVADAENEACENMCRALFEHHYDHSGDKIGSKKAADAIAARRKNRSAT